VGTTPAGYFSILPEELNMYILSFLSVPELSSVQRVSRYWRRLAEVRPPLSLHPWSLYALALRYRGVGYELFHVVHISFIHIRI
jgi:hypothetical protein